MTTAAACMMLCVSCLATSCGGGDPDTGPTASTPPVLSTAPFPGQKILQERLEGELNRLGRDPGQAASTAPAGEGNSVFDLQVGYYDLRGGAVLQWTERLLGDYDMNGVVNAADLTPLGQRWQSSVEYRDPGQAGIAWWPVGNPRNGGFAGILNGVPGFGTPAEHWRNARIDGDGNGIINLADVTPIAIHWREAADSYRVYRRGPAEDEYLLLEGEPGSGYSLLRSELFGEGRTAPENGWAFRLYYADLSIAEGDYSYYICAFNRETGVEGPPSNTVSISFDPLSVLPPQPGNEPPLAEFSADLLEGDAPLVVNFDARESSDADGKIVLYLWDWDGDGVTDHSSGASPLATHVFSEPGFYSPALTVWDDASTTGHAQLGEQISVADSGFLPPQLNLSAEPASGPRPLLVAFTASVELPGGTGELDYAWDFNSDGVVDSTEPGTQGLEMVYDLPGLHTASLRVTDSHGMSATAFTQVDVHPNTDPDASLRADRTSGTEDLLVSFDASSSSDPDGDPLNFSWDIDGDGVFELTTGGEPELQHTFTEPGSHPVTLLVEDGAGAASVDMLEISVSEFVNLPPVAVATADRTRYGVPAPITFSSVGSHDPDGPVIDEFHWDFDNDGLVDLSTDGYTVSHTYQEPGQYTARLQVIDPHGAAAEAFIELEAVDNNAPVASFTASPESGSLPLEVTFDASASSDPDGDDLEYYWEFNYEGRREFATAGSVTEVHTYLSAGMHTCGLEVRDGLGGSSRITLSIVASGPGWQVVRVDEGLPTSWVPELELEMIEGHPAIAYTVREGTGSQEGSVRFIRSEDSLGLEWPDPQVMESLSTTGQRGHGACLARNAGRPALSWVRDGGQLVFSQAMFDDAAQWLPPVVAAAPAGRSIATEHIDTGGLPLLSFVSGSSVLTTVTGADPGGQSWSAVNPLLSLGDRADWHKPELAMAGGLPVMAFVDEVGFNCSVYFMRAADQQGLQWEQAQPLGRIDNNFSGCSLQVIGGLPMVAYYGEQGLMFRCAVDPQGLSWGDPVVLDSYGYFDSAWIYEQLSLRDFGGVPAILDIHMNIWLAGDPTGSSWNEPYTVPDGYSGNCFQHALVNGHPAIAFQKDYLYYAVYLP